MIINGGRSKKRRMQKKYTLLLGRYLTPKEAKEWYKRACK